MSQAILVTPDGFIKFIHRNRDMDPEHHETVAHQSIPHNFSDEPVSVSRTVYRKVRYYMGAGHDGNPWEIFAEHPEEITDSVMAEILEQAGIASRRQKELARKPTKLQMENKMRCHALGITDTQLMRFWRSGEVSVALDIFEERGMEAAKQFLEGELKR